MLAIVGVLLQENYSPIHLDNLTAYDAGRAAWSAYGAAGAYGVLSVLCFIRWGYIVYSSRRRVQHI